MANLRNHTICIVGGEDVHMRIPLAERLIRRGYNIVIVGSGGGDLCKNQGITYFHYNLNRGLSPLLDIKAGKELIQIFKYINPDIVHAFDTKPSIIVPLSARRAGVKNVVRTITGMGHVFSSNRPQNVILRILYNSLQRKASYISKATIFQNEDDMAYYSRNNMGDKNVFFLVRGSGVDLERYSRSSVSENSIRRLRDELKLDKGLVVAMISRLVKEKGVYDYLKAAKTVCKIIPSCQFLLVGPIAGEKINAVSVEFVRSYGDYVKWIGPRKDIVEILSLVDIFVLPTYYKEGVPRVLLEAAAMEIPIITTDVPGCKDVINHGEDGIMVKPRNPNALSAAIVELANDKALRAELGKRVKRRVEKYYSLDVVEEEYSNIYEMILTGY